MTSPAKRLWYPWKDDSNIPSGYGEENKIIQVNFQEATEHYKKPFSSRLDEYESRIKKLEEELERTHNENPLLKKLSAQILSQTFRPGKAKETLEKEFKALSDEWHNETDFLSMIFEKSMHPAYQRIIGMGRDALPYIFRELQNGPDHWFWALEAITGVDPVRPENKGNMKKMTEAWLDWWAQEQEHI